MAIDETPESRNAVAQRPGHQRAERQATERRCVLLKTAEPVGKLVRLVESPDGVLVPDLAARLPGRGVWVMADGALLADAIKDGGLQKAAARSLKTKLRKGAVSDDLVAQIDSLLSRRCLDRVGLEQRAGNLVTGFDKIKAALGKKRAEKPVLIIAATDGADDGQRKIQSAVGKDIPVAKLFDREALSKALGRENVVHVVLFDSGGTEKLKADISRLLSLRDLGPLTCEAQGIEE